MLLITTKWIANFGWKWFHRNRLKMFSKLWTFFEWMKSKLMKSLTIVLNELISKFTFCSHNLPSLVVVNKPPKITGPVKLCFWWPFYHFLWNRTNANWIDLRNADYGHSWLSSHSDSDCAQFCEVEYGKKMEIFPEILLMNIDCCCFFQCIVWYLDSFSNEISRCSLIP